MAANLELNARLPEADVVEKVCTISVNCGVG